MASENGVPGRSLLVRSMVRAMRGLAIAALVLAVSLGSACGSTAEDTSQGTGAGAPGASVTAEPRGTPPDSRLQVTLVRVVDGDTIWVRMPDGREDKVRYIGIDTPEMPDAAAGGEYLGVEAAALNARLLSSGPLELELDVEERDPYGRLLAYVWAGGLLVNEQLVLDGYARAHDYPPNLSRQSQLRDAERRARAAKVGLWAPAGPSI